MSISGKQLTAARALAGWTAAALAERAGLSRDAIMKIEAGTVQPREGTIADITSAFAAIGIEFTDHNGVRQKPEGMDKLHGRDGLLKFLDLVYRYLSENGGRVCVTGVDEEQWNEVMGEAAESHFTRMTQLVDQRQDVEFSCLCEEGTRQTGTESYTKYRWQSQKDFKSVPFYVFGDYLAIIVFEGDPSPTIFLINSTIAADAYRQQFMKMWETAKVMPRKGNVKSS
ncbi:MAG: helix-turn-helix transcriptional regulator [Alphaproteobacteria bacterium]